ncbi:unnamed protein product [Adineta steineri]|uniref:G-protein coupled receptors family 1 profile domain-containing protein n=1 Tax=Adineta steineri TaxID=433720 RepID=A0A814KF99_9BILA|nr:unnamed protein product [Adineta steineri]CAF1082492.1 unnamed protein product [Adineta steineri]
MSSSIISLLAVASKQITIYLGTLTLVAGVIGGLLNIIVFLSLRTFRKSSAAFYLTIMSICNVGQMFTGLLPRIMTSGFGINWSLTSLFYCKFRLYYFNVCATTSMTCICLAIIDQYLATSSRAQWRLWCNMKIARRSVLLFVLIWIIHNIPYLIYYDHVISTTTGQVTCINTNNIFQQYAIYGPTLIIGKILPIGITFVFGLLAYHNVQQLGYRTAPLVRRELDKQLTVMILVLIVFAFFTNMPYTIALILSTTTQLTQDPVLSAQIQFAILVNTYFVYIYFAVIIQMAVNCSNKKLQSNENDIFVVDAAILQQSEVLKGFAETSDKDGVIPLPNINSATLKKVIEWMNYHQKNMPQTEDNDEELSEWGQNFLKADIAMISDLVLAANFLNIKSLLNATCALIAYMIKGRAPAEIRLQVKSQICNGIAQYDRCSTNSACGCFSNTNGTDNGICAFVWATCSTLETCDASNNKCHQRNTVCVRHPRCHNRPVCYPISMTAQHICPPMKPSERFL